MRQRYISVLAIVGVGGISCLILFHGPMSVVDWCVLCAPGIAAAAAWLWAWLAYEEREYGAHDEWDSQGQNPSRSPHDRTRLIDGKSFERGA